MLMLNLEGDALNIYSRDTFYTDTFHGGGSEGYTDYPNVDGTIGIVGKYPTIEQHRIETTLSDSLRSAAASKL
jgi:hypothetical protein